MTYLADIILHLEERDMLTDTLKEELISFDENRRKRFANKVVNVEVCTYGKYRNRRYDEIIRYDRPWMEFLVKQSWLPHENRTYMESLLLATAKKDM